jgi:CDP-diacylglycerol--glycerol-3-phosphate 3-phosphatidyltransferase
MSKKKVHSRQVKNSPWTISNGMSFFRLLLMIPLILLFDNPHGNQLSILAVCLIAYISDLGDGYVARLRNETSDLGRILDPLADKVFVLAVVISMLATGLLPPWFVYIVIGRDALIFIAGMFLKSRTGILVESNNVGKAAVVSVMLVIVIAMFPQDFASSVSRIFMIISLGLQAASLYMYGERFIKLLTKKRK